MKGNTTELFTVPEIAAILGETKQRIAYILLKYGILPKHIVGTTKLFNKQQISRIKKGCYNLRIYTPQ